MIAPAGAADGRTPDLTGKRILIVEDEFFIAEELVLEFRSFGAEVVGPLPSLAAAQRAIASGERLDGAILDINLLGDRVFPLVDTLRGRGVPCVFSTGYDRYVIPERYRVVPVCQKPVEARDIVKVLFG